MHYSRLLSITGVALTGGSLLLPFVTFPSQGDVNGIDGDAWPILILLGPVLLLAVLGDRREGLRTPAAIISILLSCAAVIFAVAKLIDAARAAVEAGGSVGLGSWAILIAAVVTVGASLTTLSRRVG